MDHKPGISYADGPSYLWYFMTILLVTGIFAPLVSPADPVEQSLGFRNFPPTWGKAMPEYNVVPNPADYDLETTKGKSAFFQGQKKLFPSVKIHPGSRQSGS
ncbi:MAG: hypothetical protein CM1200mP39_27560 [Dehalococcoidia bacterium]|nr:MAG: hypothetical protein CM1200mP39_27560 [Dehalococcoidia bacterium]